MIHDDLLFLILGVGYVSFFFLMIRVLAGLINWFKPKPPVSHYQMAKKTMNIKSGSINIITNDNNANITINGKRVKIDNE